MDNVINAQQENIAEVLSNVEGLTDKLEVKTDEFKTKLSEMGVEVVEGDNLSTLIDKFKGMSAGKKWASGESTSNNTATIFTAISGTNYNNGIYYASISGLSFIPSQIIYIAKESSQSAAFLTNLPQKFSSQYDFDKYVILPHTYESTAANCNVYTFKADDKVFTPEGEIRLPLYGSNRVVGWIAFE